MTDRNVVEVVVRSPARMLQEAAEAQHAFDATVAAAVREAEQEVQAAIGLEQHFTQLFGVPDPSVLLPPDPVAWESDRDWWHGGVGGLEPGELILSWDMVGAVPYFGGGDGSSPGVADVPGACWVSTDKARSRFYASTIPGGGDLYRVRPRGLLVDTDNPVPCSWLGELDHRFRAGNLVVMGPIGAEACACAEILEVAERSVLPAPYAARPVPGGFQAGAALPKDNPPLIHHKARGMPLPPPRDPAGPYRVCVVCHGNICRSPMAEVVLRDQLARAGLGERVIVDSAGCAAEQGKPMDPRARALMRRRRYSDDGASHRGRQFDVSWFGDRDLILATDAVNYAALHAFAATADQDRIRLFGEAAGLGGMQVPNPWHGTDGDFALVLAMIETGMAEIVAQVAATLAEGTPA